MGGSKTVKFMNVFSLESFLLYGIWCKIPWYLYKVSVHVDTLANGHRVTLSRSLRLIWEDSAALRIGCSIDTQSHILRGRRTQRIN